ncbi:MAG: DNA polymerase III subunit gamma/tau [Clostridia bacterium]|nr:DNA polymerase III subunit gamma/tau [Clostridia bacterium]
MHQALYRKWRPQTFDEVCGQEHITSILKYETANSKFSHAYLFCGSRGTGKTTCAKILAKAVNCEAPINGSPCNKCPSCISIDAGTATDVLEMDAASNNGVDNIRDIRDEVVYSPSALKYRVYIVDEVHMLSGSAFNALLKTLEEPPAHVVFILATTELHKLPSTIISRCQRFDFRRIATQVLCDRLAHISDREGIEYDTEALRIIAKLAQGGMRDAISLLELCAGTRNKITPEIVDETVGSGGRENIEQTVKAIANLDFDAIFSTIESVVRSSRDIAVFWQELISYYRDMLVIKTTSEADRYLDLTENESERLRKTSALFTKETLLYHCRVLDETLYNMQKAGSAKRMIAEMALIKMCDTTLDTSVDALLSRISKLENAVASGSAYRVRPTLEESVTDKTEKVEKSNAPVKDIQQTDASDVSELTLKPLRGWNEMAERAAAGDGSVLGFLKIAKAFRGSDGRVYIKFPNDFAKSMVQKANLSDSIRAAVNMTAGMNIGDGELELGVVDGNENISDLDEFDI